VNRTSDISKPITADVEFFNACKRVFRTDRLRKVRERERSLLFLNIHIYIDIHFGKIYLMSVNYDSSGWASSMPGRISGMSKRLPGWSGGVFHMSG
jgi:hypothetical protein